MESGHGCGGGCKVVRGNIFKSMKCVDEQGATFGETRVIREWPRKLEMSCEEKLEERQQSGRNEKR